MSTHPKLNRMLEFLRLFGVIAGFVHASLLSGNPVQQFSVLQLWIVGSIAGLTGIESIFFGEGAAQLSGYGQGGAYQRQSGINNLAVAISALVAHLANWGLYAELSVFLVLLVFLALSAVNHVYAGIRERNNSIRSYTRPIGTILLIAFVVPFILRATAYQQ